MGWFSPVQKLAKIDECGGKKVVLYRRGTCWGPVYVHTNETLLNKAIESLEYDIRGVTFLD